MTVLEKLLVPQVSRRIVEQGYDELTGPVYRPDDLIGLTPVERVASRGWERAQGYVPPLHLVGPRAKFGTLDLPCSYAAGPAGGGAGLSG